MRENRIFESVAMVVMAGFCLYFIVSTYALDMMTALFPRIIAISTLLLILCSYISERRRRISGKPDAQHQKDEPQQTNGVRGPESRRRGISWQISGVAMIGYLLLIYVIGFSLATFCYSIVLIYLTGYRKYIATCLFGLAMAIMVELGFGYAFSIPMPESLLWTLIFG
jgi:hypothetical protein